jgi:hypothetical protein
MTEPLCDVDLDALAPAPKRVRLGGKIYKLPGDMPMDLYIRIQSYGQRLEAGADETSMMQQLADDLLTLFQVHQAALKALPSIGVVGLVQALPAIYGRGGLGELAPPVAAPNRATRRAKTRTPSSKPRARKPASSA